MPRGIVLVTVTLVALGCSGGSPSGTPGTGGGGGIGGGGGAGGRGGAGGSGESPPIPACLAPFAAACPIAGTCTWGGGSRVRRRLPFYCFGSGTRLTREVTIACTTEPPMPTNEVNKVTVRKPDGSVCYTLEWTCACQFQCEGAVTWKDPAGQVVATGTTSVAGKSITCAGSGETASAPCGPSPSEPGCNPWPAGVLVYGYLNLPQSCDPGQLPLKHDNQSSPPAEPRLFHVSVASDAALAGELGAMGLL